LALCGHAAVSASPDYEALKAGAEKLFAERSYALARAQYQKAEDMDLPAAEKRWVEFRLADTQWRAQAATQNADATQLDAAKAQLESLISRVTRAEDKDRVWAEAEESLADFLWARRQSYNWSEAWPHYQSALDWWAGAPEVEMARARYLGMVWTMSRPPQVMPNYYYGSWGNFLAVNILENALRIARTDEDTAHVHFLLAMTLRNQAGDWEQRGRVPEEFESALKPGRKTDWYDDALYHYAEWMMTQGRFVPIEDGNWRQEPDFVKALELFRHLTSVYAKGETRYWDQAQQQIKTITEPQVGVSVQNIFLPDSEIQYFLNWRNVKQIELALYPVELNRDARLQEQQDWLHSIDLGRLEKIRSWSRDTGDTGVYKPGSETVRLESRLKPGAYVLEAAAGGKRARELVLVTDATLVLTASGRQALAWYCSALDGEPLAAAKIRLWERWHDGQRWQTREAEKTADKDGIAVFDLSRPANNSLELFASAILKDRQAFSVGNSYWFWQQQDPWRIYAFTDRPAYRPMEKVNWKLIARRYNGSEYSTPSEQTIEYEITDSRGASVLATNATLNAFGSAWGSLDLTEAMPLGEYRVTFYEQGRKTQIGSATLFRLEEYKLPEFRVQVHTPEENGRKKALRLGEKVEVTIQSEYYFGGPVINANVEVLVYQNPFYQSWHPPREYSWFYEDMDFMQGRWQRGYGGEGQIVKRETLKTDANGKATLIFDTPRGSSPDLEYRVEARVTDSSRREITGSGTVRVTRQRYFVHAEPEHHLFRPREKAQVDFNALDANDQPVEAEGRIKVTRDYWWEIWLDPQGKEVKGDELKRLRDAHPGFPPPAKAGQPGWRLKFQGYEHEDIASATIKTGTNGLASYSCVPSKEGYYRVAWMSEDTAPSPAGPLSPTLPIRAEAFLWVAGNSTRELGYRHDGIEIIVDKDTFHVGQKAPVMLVVPSSNRHVLFTVEGDDLYSHQVLHLEGTVKLIELDIEEKHVPNIFLSAITVNDRQIFMDTKQVVVPPEKNFLNVDIKSDRDKYQPRDEGSLTVTTRDHAGKPVPAEVALSMVDESVFYIQQDYAGDPRQFYFGTKRQHVVQTQSTMNQKGYARLVKGEKDELLDDRELRRRQQAGEGAYRDSESQNRGAEVKTPLYAAGIGGTGGGGGGAEFAGRLRMMKSAAAAPASTVALADAVKVVGYAPGSFAPEQPPGQAVQVRSDFRSTAFWQPDLVTDKNGVATVKVKYPDSLTGWKATARVASALNQFGTADVTTRTSQPLLVRLQAPRFFVVGDSLTLSAVANNNTDQALEVTVTLDVSGPALAPAAGAASNPNAQTSGWKAVRLSVPAGGEARADWIADVKAAGETKLKVTCAGAKYADAMELTYTAYEHGIEKFIAKSGKARSGDVTIKLDLPKERKPGSTTLAIQITPSLAVTMLDALPYLVRYPYGCTEQTMSRFLPAIITSKTLKDLGLHPEDIMGRVFGGVEPASAAATHRDITNGLTELDQVAATSLDRIYDFQHPDGGWGWWKEGESDPWMTAYVAWGLALARDAGVKLKQNSARQGPIDPATGLPAWLGLTALEAATNFLNLNLVVQEENPDMQAWMLHALAVAGTGNPKAPATRFQAAAFDNLWKKRDNLNAYTRSLLALCAHYFGFEDKAKVLVQNLENGVNRDERPDTSVLIGGSSPASPGQLGIAHWGEDGIYWHWSAGGVEATAFALRALLAIDPQNKLIEPVTNWLIKNRRGAQWNSTRDTAIVVLALDDYLRISGELKADLEFELSINGSAITNRKISAADVFTAPSRFNIDPGLITNSNEIKLRRIHGDGPLYFAAEARFFSLEEPIAAAGNEIFVKREYTRLVGRPTLLKGYIYDKQPLLDGQAIASGERIETVITIEAKNNYEYLMFEDLKPAGLEAVELRSGEPVYARELKRGAVERKSAGAAADAGARQADAVNAKSAAGQARRAAIRRPPRPQPLPEDADFTGRTRWINEELRDRKVALFIDQLPQGVWEIRYELRAEAPGRFHALPVLGEAMYVPEIRCNGAEQHVEIEEAKP
jgi:uncharacterized protein YfaS (alpha-2-macroglobulin family)